MKRFYKTSQVEAGGEGYLVRLDARELRTPAKNRMLLASQPLAQAIAAEWDAQDEEIVPAAMPMMGFASTAVDRVTSQRQAVIDEIAHFAESDLLCHRADLPEDLVRRQMDAWQPLLDWCAKRYGAHLEVANGIMPVEQPPASLVALKRSVGEHDDSVLAGLHTLTSIYGSVIMALAVIEGRLTPLAAFDASQLDEDFQVERWGTDSEAETRRANLRRDALDAARFIELHRAG